MITVLSIDIGLKNLGIVEAIINEKIIKTETGTNIGTNIGTNSGIGKTIFLEKVVDCKLIDIYDITEYCTDNSCKLYHEKCPADYVSHLFKNYPIFDTCDKILIENQPLNGLTSIQEIINFKYRNKTIIVSPNSMHAFFKIDHKSIRVKKNDFDEFEKFTEEEQDLFKKKSYEKDYAYRKRCVVGIAKNYLKNFFDYQNSERKHDLADAMCLLLYWISSQNK